MLGGGTSLGTIPNNTTPICLDLTRLLSRTGMVHTGVDRVEWAYLEWCLGLDRPVFGLVRTAFGYLLLDRAGMAYFHGKLRHAEWGRPDGLSRLAFRLSETRRCAETALRKCAIARAAPPLLARTLRKIFPDGVLYLNTGHSNLARRVLGAFKAVQRSQSVVFIHDMIPLDWPDHQRAGTVEQFEKRMRVVSKFADALICNSQQTLDATTHHFLAFGRMPPAVVAHLGVEMPKLTNTVLPDIPKPYVITVGTIEPRKNHAFLLDLWEEWSKERTSQPPHLVICGNRGWKNEDVFVRLDNAETNGLHVTELNGLDDAQLMGLVSGAQAALFPSLVEGYGLPQIEALSLGIPIICDDLAIYREVLGEFPVYAATSSAYIWRNAIEKLLQQDSADPDRMGINQIPYIVPKWDTHFNIVLKHFG